MAIPFQYESEYKRKLCTPDEAARVVKSGDWLDISIDGDMTGIVAAGGAEGAGTVVVFVYLPGAGDDTGEDQGTLGDGAVPVGHGCAVAVSAAEALVGETGVGVHDLAPQLTVPGIAVFKGPVLIAPAPGLRDDTA